MALRPIFLLLLEESTLQALGPGLPPKLVLSHDRCLLHVGHEALRRGYRVVLGSVVGSLRGQEFIEVSQVYPTWSVQNRRLRLANVRDAEAVFSVHFGALHVRHLFRRAKIVGINPAVYFVENPGMFGGHAYIESMRAALRDNLDYVVVQNVRMQDVCSVFYEMLAGWRHRDRILVAPFGFVPEEQTLSFDRQTVRARMGLAFDDIAIINAGGVWKWTDFNTFLRAFVRVARAGDNRLKLFIMGLRQKQNIDHGDYIEETEGILERNRDLVGRSIVCMRDWDEASACIQAYIAGADVGLNVNKDTLENWQSQRVRLVNYAERGLAVINTVGDYASTSDMAKAMFLVQPECEESYVGVLETISRNPGLLAQRRAAMREVRHSMASVSTTGPLVEAIAAGALPRAGLPKRTTRAATIRRRGAAAGRRAIRMIQSVLDTYPRGRRIAMRLRASQLLRDVLSRLGMVAAVK